MLEGGCGTSAPPERPATAVDETGPSGARRLLAEYIVHGWDLAVASGQAVSLRDADAAIALAALRPLLKPEYRGEAFGPEVPVPAGTPPVARLVAFMGRDPAWTPPSS